MTPRLYYDDPLLTSFEAEVIAHASFAGRPSVLLDRTAFYPESGGQMADAGTLGGAAIHDVQVDDAGAVHHVVEGELPLVGARIHGEIDRERRRVHMALHSAQHMLSRAFVEGDPRAETVSARLGETECTLDLDVPELDDRALGAAEDLVNAIVDDDRPIRAFVVPPAEVPSLGLRRTPKVEGDVRVVDIGGFDLTPCGGTHCLHTSQVGLVRVKRVERYKGKSRVIFSAGRRARLELGDEARSLKTMALELGCGAGNVPAALDKLRRELCAVREDHARTLGRLVASVAVELLSTPRSGDLIVASFEGVGRDFLRTLAKRLTAERPTGAAVLADRGAEHSAVVVARGALSSFDCAAFLARTSSVGGRGGGLPEHAEGQLPRDVDVAALVAELT
jgi:alanyl-tRNA synthetase